MELKTDENELIKAFTTLIKLPLPDLRASLAHKALELEYRYKDDIEEYREIESLIHTEGKQEKTTGTGKGKESVKRLNFELEKIKGNWTVFPIVHPDVINHILTHEQECEPGIIKMGKINLNGEMIDIGFAKKDENHFTGQIIKKCPEEKTKQAPKRARKSDNKTEDLKKFLTYLMTDETFCNCMIDEFFERLKPLIDRGIFKKSSKNSLI